MSKNRISYNASNKSKKIRKINSFFLACELKPKTFLFKSELETFAYNIKPCFTYGKLGVISYHPTSYAITRLNTKDLMVGYVMEISNPDTILLLDKLKGFYGPGSFNYHIRRIVHVYLDTETVISAWAYVLSDDVLNKFESIERVGAYGIWDDKDEELSKFIKTLESL